MHRLVAADPSDTMISFLRTPMFKELSEHTDRSVIDTVSINVHNRINALSLLLKIGVQIAGEEAVKKIRHE